MNSFLAVFMIQAFAIQFPQQFDFNFNSLKKNVIKSCEDYNLISHIGYYNYMINKKCKITASLNSGSVRMFYFIDPIFHPDYNLSIDGIPVTTGPQNTNGRSIYGNDNATLKFYNVFSNKMIINIWLLPLHLCTNLSLYAYNAYSIDLKIPYTSSEICIFSPSSDSSNNKFRVSFGINSRDKNHISSLYSSSYYAPQEIAKKSKIVTAKVKGSYIIEFKFNNSDDSYQETNYSEPSSAQQPTNQNYYLDFIFYKRTTYQIESENTDTKSSIGSVAKCNGNDGCTADFFPPLEVHYEDPINLKFVAYLIFALVSTIVIIIIIIVYCIRIKRKKELINKKKDKPNLDYDNNSYANNENSQNIAHIMEIHVPENWEYYNLESPNNSVKSRKPQNSFSLNNQNLS